MLKVLELFGGIGACSKALQRLNIPFELVDYVDKDKYVVKSFNAIHNTNYEPQDIQNWDKDVQVDLIMHGSPCQDFSLSGKQAGGDINSGTRSSLMYETVRIVNKLQPKYVIWENVKNVLSRNHIHNFKNYLQQMELIGYTNYYSILNAKDYGIPQDRERVFVVSIKKSLNQTFIFPKPIPLKLTIKDMLFDKVDDKFYLQNYGVKESKLFTADGNIKRYTNSNIIDEFKEGQMATTSYPNGWGHGPRTHNLCITLNTVDKPSVKQNGVIRKITPNEAWVLMGFDSEDCTKASKYNSNTQLYKQAGNSIVVNVLMAILKQLIKE